MEQLRIFIGYDPREAVAYHVCEESIREHSSQPVSITALDLRTMRKFYAERHQDGSNAFIYSRFLIPYLCGFRGLALFLDGDMLVRGDVAELFADPMLYQGVRVVKHDYRTKYPVKYLGYPNADYPRKNWSSAVMWNCGFAPHRVLTPEFVASSTGAYLHRFSWLVDSQIGELPMTWNRLVLEQELQDDDKLRHFTVGTPCFADYADCDGAEEWHRTYARMIAPMRSNDGVGNLRRPEN